MHMNTGTRQGEVWRRVIDVPYTEEAHVHVCVIGEQSEASYSGEQLIVPMYITICTCTHIAP